MRRSTWLFENEKNIQGGTTESVGYIIDARCYMYVLNRTLYEVSMYTFLYGRLQVLIALVNINNIGTCNVSSQHMIVAS